MTNWRLIEAELVAQAEHQNIQVLESHSGDKYIECHEMYETPPLNLTIMAQHLSERMTLTAHPIQVKAAAECEAKL